MSDKIKLWSFIFTIAIIAGGWTWKASSLASDITTNVEKIDDVKSFIDIYIASHNEAHRELRGSYVKSNKDMRDKIDNLTEHITELTRAVTVLSTIDAMKKEGYRK